MLLISCRTEEKGKRLKGINVVGKRGIDGKEIGLDIGRKRREKWATDMLC